MKTFVMRSAVPAIILADLTLEVGSRKYNGIHISFPSPNGNIEDIALLFECGTEDFNNFSKFITNKLEKISTEGDR